MNILTKLGVPTMNHFRFYKQEGNGSVAFDFYADGNTSPTTYSSDANILQDSNWTHFAIVHEIETGSLRIYADGDLIIDESSVIEANNSHPLDFRFSKFTAGHESLSFKGFIDDLRFYDKALTTPSIANIFNHGGGDYQTIEILGAGTTRITARQSGNAEYEKALPVYNYLSVIKSSQTIDFKPLIDRSVGDFPFTLSAKASSGLPVKFSLSDLSLASIQGDTVTVRNAGELIVTAAQPGNEKFFAAPPVTQSFTIRFGNLFADSIPGLDLWLDAIDINNDGLEDKPDDFLISNKISLWADRSGNNNSPVEANSSRMPTWINYNSDQSLLGKPVVNFNSQLNQTLALQSSIADPAFIFFVAKQSFAQESKLLGGDLITTNASGFFSLAYNQYNPEIYSVQPTNNWSVCTLGISPPSQNLWVNGELMGSSSSLLYPKPLSLIGGAFSGDIAEILVFTEGLNFVNRQKVEAYLAHKWQLENRLPELHPYYNTPPAFGGTQSITWLGLDGVDEDALPKLPVKAANDPDFTLSAVASSGLPVIYSSSDPTILAIADNQAKIIGPGKVTITAYQTGNTRFFAAPTEAVTLQIVDFSDPNFRKDTQEIEFSVVPEKVREDPPFQIQALAESSGENHLVYRLPVILKIESGPATIDPLGVVTLDGSAGTIVISANQSGNAYIEAAETKFLTIEISNRTRPTILFSDLKKEGPLDPVMVSGRPMPIPGAYASSGGRISLASSDPTIVEISGTDQIIAHKTGTVTLSFTIPADENFASALPRTRTLEVVKPTKSAWLENRRKDPRYNALKSRFIDQRKAQLSTWTDTQATYDFDQDGFDSDGDGYSNLFERATGMDSLGFDQINAPQLIGSESGKSRISFVRYTNPISSTGEQFDYIIEESLDLRTWIPSSPTLENRIQIGGGMERVTYLANEPAQPKVHKFLRLTIKKIE